MATEKLTDLTEHFQGILNAAHKNPETGIRDYANANLVGHVTVGIDIETGRNVVSYSSEFNTAVRRASGSAKIYDHFKRLLTNRLLDYPGAR